MTSDQSRASRIVLVRHARPVIDPERPPGEWLLDADHASAIVTFVETLRPLGVDGVVTSPEPKAMGTAQAVATALGLPLSEDDDLREQGNEPMPWFSDEEFQRVVAEHFRRPEEVVMCGESSTHAGHRFSDAVARARERFRRPALVTHGRVMCGYLRNELQVDPVPIWSDLRMPDALVVDLAERTLFRPNGVKG